MDGHVGLPQQQRRSSSHMGLQRCALGLTLLLLLFEVIVSRLCNCLINMVDSFHTLYLLFHLALQHLQTRQPPLSSSATSASSSSIAPPPIPPDSLPSNANSNNSMQNDLNATSQTPAAAATTTTPNHDPAPEALHPDSETITDAPASEPSTTIDTTNANTSSTTSTSSLLSEPSAVARLQPFGALVSALLVASLCVSVTLEILHHVLQPHPIQRPLLATAASALSLLFNAVVLAFAWGRGCRGGGGGGRPLEAPAAGAAADLSTDTSATTTSTPGSGVGSNHSRIALGDEDGSLMFCNPAASSVLDGKHVSFAAYTVRNSKHVSFAIPAAPDCQGCDRDGALPSAEPNAADGHLNNLSQSQQSKALELEDSLSRVPVYTAHAGNTGNAASLYNGHRTTPLGAPSTTAQRGTSRLWSRMTLLRDLLCPCLALANALTSLLGTPDCHHPQESCSSLVYLDPALSTAAVLVLLAFALPEVHRLGLLLLQSRPPALSVPELKRRLMAVQGVGSVHELHVWQLNESCWVASVHVHVNVNLCGCNGHWSGVLNKVVEGVTETLRCAGVSVCTVQPEVFTERVGGETAVPPVVPGGHGDWPCSLACGKKCEKMLCCSPPTREDTRDTTPSSGGKAQDIIIENTHV